jgi:hypothetical protein
VPDGSRYLLVGSDCESALLHDHRMNLAQFVGDSEAESVLTTATIGDRHGFRVTVSQETRQTRGYAFAMSAFIVLSGAPSVPQSAPYAPRGGLAPRARVPAAGCERFGSACRTTPAGGRAPGDAAMSVYPTRSTRPVSPNTSSGGRNRSSRLPTGSARASVSTRVSQTLITGSGEYRSRRRDPGSGTS